MHSNKVEYIIAAGLYCMKHNVKVSFYMPEFYSKKVVMHLFHVDNNESYPGIIYDVIIRYDLMIQLGLSVNLRRRVLQCDGAIVLTNKPSGLIVQTYLTSHKCFKKVMQTAELVSTRKATEIMVKMIKVSMHRHTLNK